jgi:hypothetical protein
MELSLSDKSERGVQLMVVGMIIFPIYLHALEVKTHIFVSSYSFQIVPLFTGRFETESDSYFHVVFYHLLPSLWINLNMIYNYYRVSS